MTPEQRDQVRSILQSESERCLRVAAAREGHDVERSAKARKRAASVQAALALLTPEAEADLRLVKAVRALGIDPKWCDLEADRWDSVAGSIELDMTSAARVSRTFAALHRLLAAELREEAGR